MSYSLAILIERKARAKLKRELRLETELEQMLEQFYDDPLAIYSSNDLDFLKLARNYGLITKWDQQSSVYDITVPDPKSEHKEWTDHGT